MGNIEPTKPSHEEWMRWSHIVADRLSTSSYIYSSEPHPQCKLDEMERQTHNSIVVDYLRRIYKLIDHTTTPTESLADVAHHDEQAIDGLRIIVHDVLDFLPTLSGHIQEMLQSHWREAFPTPLAETILYGHEESGEDGVGSGYSEHGRLPASLDDLLTREAKGESRKPREELARSEDSAPTRGSGIMRRWGDVNSHFMRRAGQME